MPVKFSNNTIKKLGTDLPTVYFERIELFDTEFKIKLALYVDGNVDEQEAYNEYITNVLSKLQYYIVLVMDGPVSPEWSIKNMPSPTVELISSYDFNPTGQNLEQAIQKWGLISALTNGSGADFGLEPVTSTGNSVLYGPAIDGTTYNSLVPNYYANDEIGQDSTARIEKLVSGQKTAFELVRRTNDYQIVNKSTSTPAEYFDISKGPGSLTHIATKDIYRPPNNSVTDEKGDYPEPIVIPFSMRGPVTYTWSDPNLNNTAIGRQIQYPPNAGTGGNTIKLSFTDFDTNYEIIYKPDGNIVYKHSITIEEAYAGLSTDDSATENTFLDWTSNTINNVPRISMIAFSSIVDLNVGAGAGSTAYVANGDTSSGDPTNAAKAKLPIAKMHDLMTSDITYETITEYGKVVDKPIVIYVDADGEEYEGVPIQGTDSLYYEEGEISLGQIKQIFDDFSKTNRSTTQTDRTDPVANSGIIDMENGLLFALNEYGEDSSLLVKLNQLRKSFPDTSSASKTGKLYQELKKLIFETNNAVRRGKTLMKRLARSAVVVDYRHEIHSAWVRPAHAEAYEWSGVYHPLNNADYLNPMLAQISKFGDRYSPQGTSNPENAATDQVNIFINGFYFFDYEKAIQRISGLSKILDVNKLESLFGRRITQSKFKLLYNRAKLSTFTSNTDDFYSYQEGPESSEFFRVEDEVTDIGNPSTKYSTGDPIPTVIVGTEYSDSKGTVRASYNTSDQAPYTTSSRFGASTTGDENGYNEGLPRASITVIDDNQSRIEGENSVLGISAGTSYSYTALRNFEFLDNLKFDGKPYRLMGFEFQYVIPSQNLRADYDPTYQDYLTFDVSVEDDTTSIFYDLSSNYGSMLKKINIYGQEASDFCSYNNIDGFFNEFFANYQNQKYLSAPQQAPWIIAPLTYHLHLDLLTNEHNGDKLKILDEALKISERINPETGTLPELLSFIIKTKAVYTAYYDKSNVTSPAYEVNEMQSSARYNGPYNIEFGGNDGTTSPASTFYPLPKLQEMYYSTEMSATEASVPTGANVSMVKMSFGIKNIPSAIGSGVSPATPQIILSTRGTAIAANKIRDTHFKIPLERTYTGDEGYTTTYDTVARVDAGWDEKTSFQIATYSQLSIPISATDNTVNMTWNTIITDYAMESAVVTEKGTVLQSSEWIRSGIWDLAPSSQNRAATTSPKFISIYLFAGVTYSLEFRVSSEPLTVATSENYDADHDSGTDDNSGTSYTALKRSSTFTFTVPKESQQSTAPRLINNPGAISYDGHTNFYLDYSDVSLERIIINDVDIAPSWNHNIGNGKLYGYTSNEAWVDNSIVGNKMAGQLQSTPGAISFPLLPTLLGFPGKWTSANGYSADDADYSWSAMPSNEWYTNRVKDF